MRLWAVEMKATGLISQAAAMQEGAEEIDYLHEHRSAQIAGQSGSPTPCLKKNFKVGVRREKRHHTVRDYRANISTLTQSKKRNQASIC